VHWIAPILAGVPFGAGMILVFTSIIGYLIDVYLMYAASALAANAIMRSILGAVFPLLVFPPSPPVQQSPIRAAQSDTDWLQIVLSSPQVLDLHVHQSRQRLGLDARRLPRARVRADAVRVLLLRRADPRAVDLLADGEGTRSGTRCCCSGRRGEDDGCSGSFEGESRGGRVRAGV
jgi:hypothetical protein